MTRRLAIAMATVLSGAALGSACSEEDIVIARLPRTNDSGAELEAKRCIDTFECTGTSFCERKSCRDIAGLCASRSLVCEDEPSPVCGCDGVTYWNDCLRRFAGVTAMRRGECEPGMAQMCGRKPPPGPGPGPGEDCPDGLVCARLLFPIKADPNDPKKDCPPFVPGTCWALPAVCPAHAGPDRWTMCGLPEPKCTTTCDAIRSGAPHRPAFACP